MEEELYRVGLCGTDKTRPCEEIVGSERNIGLGSASCRGIVVAAVK